VAVLNGYFPGNVVAGNVFAGGTASRYPTGNYFPTDFTAQFINAAPGDYRLASSSVAIKHATDGTNIGADIATIASQTSGISTWQTPAPLPPPPTPRGLRVLRF
jgi:hypothetical protein